MNSNQAQQPQQPASTGSVLLAVFAVLVVVGLLINAAGCGDEEGGALTEQEGKYQAEYSCETMVERQLRSPSTARFVGVTSTGAIRTGWTVRGGVDAQNGFGAVTRSAFECRVTYLEASEVFRTRVVELRER